MTQVGRSKSFQNRDGNETHDQCAQCPWKVKGESGLKFPIHGSPVTVTTGGDGDGTGGEDGMKCG